ncbi:DUF1326 domain-containing protein [Candidatus Halocynthiibacter alkanivorans]|uniref:DUF1326 domain-containing protein n=1 Tax=Candidatus Halocynthiibacter alkanivorans TaxID=2267619 RepID=UPI000DF1630B|nr:DUF1326 domain-containing protein [Candidatus Halocynthiibacter alkanivorans]
MTEWSIQGAELTNCNCNFGCPCQFAVLPSDGTCEAAVFFNINKGHYGDVNLDGLRAAAVYKWPGPIHEGNGEMQLIIDESASAEQRAALGEIMNGRDTTEMATMWFVYSAMAPTKHDTLYKPVSIDMDPEARTGKGSVSGVVEINVKPIPNIVTGDPHRIRINLPHGFEFDVAEMASGSTTTSGGAISLLKNNNTHAHLAQLHLTGAGVVR